MPFASHLAMSIGFFAGIIPAVIIIFMTLKEYDEYYEDKHFFFLLVLGLFAGTMTALIYYWSIIYLGQNLSLLTLPLIIVGFAIYEILLFTIILSMKRFGGKYDLTYYGVVFGGSIGAVLNMFSLGFYPQDHFQRHFYILVYCISILAPRERVGSDDSWSIIRLLFIPICC